MIVNIGSPSDSVVILRMSSTLLIRYKYFLFIFFRYSGVKAITVAMICTCFDALNIPVFWPILVMYFILLFVITMKRQIKVRFLITQG